MSQYFGGIPTAPDVQKLIETMEMKPGVELSYEEFARIIGAKIKSNRFNTVALAWRRHLFEKHNVAVKAERGKFRALAPGERLDYEIGRFGRGTRQIARSARNSAAIKASSLTETDQVRLAHFQRGAAAILAQAAEARQALEPPKPAAALPTRQPLQVVGGN